MLTLREGDLIHRGAKSASVSIMFSIQKRKRNEARVQSRQRKKDMTETKDDQNMPVGKRF
jgi:DNA repair exonuclease SbcCD ATPase subunit